MKKIINDFFKLCELKTLRSWSRLSREEIKTTF